MLDFWGVIDSYSQLPSSETAYKKKGTFCFFAYDFPLRNWTFWAKKVMKDVGRDLGHTSKHLDEFWSSHRSQQPPQTIRWVHKKIKGINFRIKRPLPSLYINCVGFVRETGNILVGALWFSMVFPAPKPRLPESGRHTASVTGSGKSLLGFF